jgi:hypothetical protein
MQVQLHKIIVIVVDLEYIYRGILFKYLNIYLLETRNLLVSLNRTKKITQNK